MKLELIKKDVGVSFVDNLFVNWIDVMEDVFDEIAIYEKAVDVADPEDFKVMYANAEPTNNFNGAFITSMYGTYLLHDLREEKVAYNNNEEHFFPVLYYSLTKLSEDATN
jgi:hypothetical protein